MATEKLAIWVLYGFVGAILISTAYFVVHALQMAIQAIPVMP